jgi:hypothetical protein
MERTSKGDLPLWRVTKIGGSRAQELSEMRAKTAQEAIKRYFKEFSVTDPNQLSRLAAYRFG